MPKDMRKEVQPVLTEEEQHQVARWLGEFILPMRIPGLIKTTFGKQVDGTYAYPFQARKKWSLLIDRYRQEWLVKIAEVPLFHKKYRLQKLMRLVERLDTQWEATGVTPKDYELRLLRILDRARLEMEEKKEEHTWYFTNLQLNNASDAELVQRREELLKRIQQFRLPVRSVTNGMGHREQIIEATAVSGTQGDGGSDGVGHVEGHRPVESPPAEG